MNRTAIIDLLKSGVTALALVASAALAPPVSAHRDHYSDAEIDRLLAPVALYPDTVLSHLLIAATHPEQVREAAAWSRRHPDLSGEDAVDAVEKRDWDPSVKALVAFPELLARMDEDPEWTEHLGDAFLRQEGVVMDRVQHLRDRAYDAGRLESLEHVRVIREREYIYIEPVHTHHIYVPYYDPWYVYGSWGWASYPPYCWRTWYGRPASYYHSGFYWGIGFRVRPAFYFTAFYWPQRHVVVARDFRRPIYSSRQVHRQQDVRRWHQGSTYTAQRPERTHARAGSASRDERSTRNERWIDQRPTRGNAASRQDGRASARSGATGDAERAEKRQREPAGRSDEVRERLRERRQSQDSARGEREGGAGGREPLRGSREAGAERGESRPADEPRARRWSEPPRGREAADERRRDDQPRRTQRDAPQADREVRREPRQQRGPAGAGREARARRDR